MHERYQQPVIDNYLALGHRLHDRMPVILHDEAAQKAWLDTGAIPEAE